MKEKFKFIGSIISDTAALTLIVAGVTLGVRLGVKLGNTISDTIDKIGKKQ